MRPPQISPAQLRAARAWLELSQDDLAAKAGVGRRAIADFERGARLPYDRTLDHLRAAIEELGITFVFAGELGAGIHYKISEHASGSV